MNKDFKSLSSPVWYEQLDYTEDYRGPEILQMDDSYSKSKLHHCHANISG